MQWAVRRRGEKTGAWLFLLYSSPANERARRFSVERADQSARRLRGVPFGSFRRCRGGGHRLLSVQHPVASQEAWLDLFYLSPANESARFLPVAQRDQSPSTMNPVLFGGRLGPRARGRARASLSSSPPPRPERRQERREESREARARARASLPSVCVFFFFSSPRVHFRVRRPPRRAAPDARGRRMLDLRLGAAARRIHSRLLRPPLPGLGRRLAGLGRR